MTANDFTRTPRTTLNGAINNSVTSITITSATGWATPGDAYYATIFSATGSDTFLDFLDGETVKVTALTGAVLTVTRAQDDTTAAAWSDGDHIVVTAPATIFDEHNDHAEGAAGSEHGSGYLTGTAHDARPHAGVTAGDATIWETARTLTLTGDATGASSAFDGSGNISFATTLATGDAGNLDSGSLLLARIPEVGYIANHLAGTTVATATFTDVTWGTETLDTDGFSPASATITIPTGKAGWYALSGAIVFTSATTGEMAARVLVGGSAYGDYHGLVGTAVAGFALVVKLAVTDTIKIQAYQSSGGNETLSTSSLINLVQLPIGV